MKIYTDYIPEGCDYLTAGKKYDVVGMTNPACVLIENDNHDQYYVIIENDRNLTCSHLNDKKSWKVVE